MTFYLKALPKTWHIFITDDVFNELILGGISGNDNASNDIFSNKILTNEMSFQGNSSNNILSKDISENHDAFW